MAKCGRLRFGVDRRGFWWRNERLGERLQGRGGGALFPFTEYLGFNFNGNLGNELRHLLDHSLLN